MPYAIEANPTGRGYFVVTEGSGERHSGHPLALETAQAQQRALYTHLADTEKMHDARRKSHYSIMGHEKKQDFK